MYRLATSTLLSLIVALCVNAVDASEADLSNTIQIEFNAVAMVRNTHYTLGELVTLTTSDPGIRSTLEQLVIGKSPRPGQSDYIRQFEVTARIDAEMAGASRKLRWRGKSSLRVQSMGQLANSQTIAATATSKLQAWLAQESKRSSGVTFQVEMVGKDKEMYVPFGEVTYSARTSNSASIRSRIPVWVDILVNGEVFASTPVWFSVSARKKVPVATRRIKRHERISSESISIEIRDVAGLRPATVDEINGEQYRARRSVGQGQIVLNEDLESLPAVEKGQLITVYTGHGSVELAIQARALSDGLLTEEIRVENPQTNDSYRAVVIGKRLARVD